MTNWKDLRNKVSGAMFDGPPPEAEVVPAAPVSSTTPREQANLDRITDLTETTTFQPGVLAAAPASAPQGDTEAYLRVKEKTDYTRDPTYAQLNATLDKLKVIISDPHARLQAAVVTSGLTRDQILLVFSQAIDRLKGVQDTFKKAWQAKIKTEVEDKKAKAADLDKKIQDLQEERRTLQKEAIDAEDRLDKAIDAFNAAADRRLAEITHELDTHKALLT